MNDEPAFPTPCDTEGHESKEYVSKGMTLHEYYVGQALLTSDLFDNETYQDLAKRCFDVADALMAERERRSKQ